MGIVGSQGVQGIQGISQNNTDQCLDKILRLFGISFKDFRSMSNEDRSAMVCKITRNHKIEEINKVQNNK